LAIAGKVIEGLFISPGFAANCSRLLLLLLFGKTVDGQLLLQLGVTVVFSWPATVITATVVAFR